MFGELSQEEQNRLMQFMVASPNVRFTYDHSDQTYIATINLAAPSAPVVQANEDEEVADGTFNEYADSVEQELPQHQVQREAPLKPQSKGQGHAKTASMSHRLREQSPKQEHQSFLRLINVTNPQMIRVKKLSI